MGKNEQYLARLGRELDRIQAFSVEETRSAEQMKCYTGFGFGKPSIIEQMRDSLALRLAHFLLDCGLFTVEQKETDEGITVRGTITVVVPEGAKYV